MRGMTRRERLAAAVRGEPVDRVPYAVWRHFPAVDRSPAGLAQSSLRFHERYGSDFLKLTPRGGYTVVAWGCVEAEAVRPDGSRGCARCAVRAPEDWRRIRPLDPTVAEGYTEQLEAIVRMGFDRRIGDAPVLPTLFSPLSVARKLSGDRLAADVREHPGLVRDALEAIAETTQRFAEAALAEGAGGLFYSIQGASRSVLDEAAYAEFGEAHDRRILGATLDRSFLTVVHAHGDALMFDRLATLPGHAWNWDDRRTAPSLAEAQARVAGAVVGGLDQWAVLRDGTPDAAVAQVQDTLAQTAGRRLIVAPGCVLPEGTPDATIAAVVRALGGPLRPIPGVATA